MDSNKSQYASLFKSFPRVMQIKIKFLIDISKMPLYYSTIEKNEVIPFAATRMDLETITLNEVRQVVTYLLLGVSHGKESACSSAGDLGSIPGPGRSPGEGNGNPLQYSCLGNSTDKGLWQATVHGLAKSQTPLSY